MQQVHSVKGAATQTPPDIEVFIFVSKFKSVFLFLFA